MQTKEFAAPDVEGQAEQVMLNLGAILEAAGSSFGQVRLHLLAMQFHAAKTAHTCIITCLQLHQAACWSKTTTLFSTVCRAPPHSRVCAVAPERLCGV